MRRPPCRLVAMLVGASVLVGQGVASAQSTSIDTHRVEPATSPIGFYGVRSARVPADGTLSLAVWFDYTRGAVRVVERSRGELALVRDRVIVEAQAEVGLWGRVSLTVAAPFVLFQEGDATPGRPLLESPAVGDGRFGLRVRMLGEEARLGRRLDGPGLAVAGEVLVPWGSTNAYAGEGTTRLGVHVVGDLHALGVGFGVSLGVRHRIDERNVEGVPFRTELHGGVAARVPLPWFRDWAAILELRGIHDLLDPFGAGARTIIEIDLAQRIGLGDVALTTAVGTGFTGGVGAPQLRVAAGLAWTPSPLDGDGDGVPDTRDACPLTPEDRDGFEDENGCPDFDDDRDGVVDRDDHCPREPAPYNADEDEDGCVDPPRDTDNDGVIDPNDRCVAVPEDIDGVMDEDGCVDDDDEDGVPDVIDACRDLPEDRDSHYDDDGCPDRDDNLDNLPDPPIEGTGSTPTTR